MVIASAGATGARAAESAGLGTTGRSRGNRRSDGSGRETDKRAEKKTAQGKPAAGPAPSLEPKMTIAVHEPSNSLIVTAPEQLFQEVEQLVKLIDSRSEEDVQVITNNQLRGRQVDAATVLSRAERRRASSGRSTGSQQHGRRRQRGRRHQSSSREQKWSIMPGGDLTDVSIVSTSCRLVRCLRCRPLGQLAHLL